MNSKIGTYWQTIRRTGVRVACGALFASLPLLAADLTVPRQATANSAITIGTAGEGSGELYLIGPTARIKRNVRLGDSVQLKPEEIQAAGLYTVILRGGGGAAKSFWVAPAAPQAINFLAQPSRVAASTPDAISGTVFVMDRYHNLVLSAVPVKFELALQDAASERTVNAREGVAWARMDSGHHAGNAQFTASVDDSSVKRIIQQVAAEPCNVNFHAHPAPAGIVVETDLLRDCAGNAIPDGTIVTFTDIDAHGKSTVDAVVKRGIARAELPAAPAAVISAASGIVSGNELHWNGDAR